jgi:glycosyltransferase involved in cell wall biosynthesis
VKPLRVLHVPYSVGGNPQGLARAERELGLESVSVVFAPGPYAYEADEVLAEPGVGRLRYSLRRARLLARALGQFDVIHFNFGRTLMPARLAYSDLPLLRRLGKTIAVTFQGDDVRRGDVARRLGGRSLPVVVPENYPASVDTERRRRVEAFDRHADLIFYLNPDLAHVLPERARFMAYAHAAAPSEPPAERGDGTFVVVHAPSDRTIKGTAHVVAAVDALRAEGVDVRLELVEGLPNVEARAAYARADVAVDQLNAGWYGGFAVEAMAAGTPVVAWIRDDDLGVLDQGMREALPVVRADPDSLTSVLRDLLASGRPALHELGRRSWSYVSEWHDPLRVAAAVTAAYEEAVERKRGDAR